MKRHLRTLSVASLCFILLFSLCLTAQAQIRGKALYEKLRTDKNLVKFEGLSRVRWIPDGKAYYLYEDNTFKKVDPVTGKKNSLLLKDKDDRYLEPDDAIFLSDNIHFLWTSERSGWKESCKFLTDSFSSFDTPRRLILCHADGKKIRELGKSIISKEFKDFKLIKPEHFVFKSADEKYDLDYS
ncbi:MAG: hypothetical protein U9Q97_07705 [Acidobacteriota bacterium]|nr:hypothetical protein [Acidobacteriota bacterium]